MSLYEEKNVDQSIVLQIGPQLVFENVKQMKNTTKLNLTCCKSSTEKVDSMHVNEMWNKIYILHLMFDTGYGWTFMYDCQRILSFPINLLNIYKYIYFTEHIWICNLLCCWNNICKNWMLLPKSGFIRKIEKKSWSHKRHFNVCCCCCSYHYNNNNNRGKDSNAKHSIWKYYKEEQYFNSSNHNANNFDRKQLDRD